jgi:hypothetical protein
LFQIYIVKTLISEKNILRFNIIVRERLLGSLVLTWLSKVDHPEVAAWGNDLYQQWTGSPNPDTENP